MISALFLLPVFLVGVWVGLAIAYIIVREFHNEPPGI